MHDASQGRQLLVNRLDQLADLGLPTYRAVTCRDRNVEEKLAAAGGRFTVFGRQVDLQPPVDWNQNPFGSRSGVYELHTLQFLDVLVHAFLDDADPKALEQALAVAIDWINGSATDREGTNEFAWYDMAVGLRAPYLAYVLRASAHAGVLSESDAEVVLNSLLEHGRFLAADENYAHGHNHGLFQDEGLLLLCGYLPFLDESAAWQELAWTRCMQTLRETIEWDEGVQLEHSPAYHLAMTHYVRRILGLPGADGEMLGQLLTRLEDTAGWLVLPDGTLPELGDTDSIPAASWAARSAEGKHGLKILPRAGLAVVKEQDSFLIVSAWYHGRGHKHADELSFILYETGHRVLGDSGRYGYYENEPARMYARSSQAHNALIVDGESFDWQSAEPYGSGILGGGSGAGWHAIEGVNPLLRDAEHHRLFLFLPGKVLVVVDEVRATESRAFTRLLHFGPDLEVETSASGLSMRANGFRGAVSNWADATVDWTLSRGQLEPDLRGWTFPRDRQSVPIWTAEADSTGTGLTSAMAIALHDADVCVRNVCRVGKTVSVSIDLDGQALEIAATSSDGAIEITQEDA
jgi:Heparinase II/III-like protein/Heparinase II/III N-terminus